MEVVHPRRLDRQRSIALLIDVQDRLFGAIPPETQAEVLRNAGILLQAINTLHIPLVVTEQYPKGLGPTVDPLARQMGGAPVFEKLDFSALEVPGVRDFVHSHADRPQVVVFGIETHVCVYQSVLSLLQWNRQVHVVADASASRRHANSRRGLALMREAGAIVTDMETVLFQWLERAGTPEFKSLQKLLM